MRSQRRRGLGHQPLVDQRAADAAADALYAARGVAQRFGGSHAQRDLIDQTLLSAAAACTRGGIGRALINERRMAKPLTPLSAHWQAQVQGATGIAA